MQDDFLDLCRKIINPKYFVNPVFEKNEYPIIIDKDTIACMDVTAIKQCMPCIFLFTFRL